MRYVDSLQLLLYSSATSVIVLFISLCIQGKFKLLTRISNRDLRRSILLGLLNPFIYYVVLFKAYSLLLAQEAQALNYTWPITLSILSIPLLRQKIRFKSILAIIISFIGVIIIGTRGQLSNLRFENPIGVILAVGSSLFWALFWIANIKDERDENLKLFLNFGFGFLFILTATLIFSEIKLPVLNGIAGVVYVGVFEMGITFVLWMKALQLSENTAKVSNLIYISPFISLVLIKYIVGERILLSTIAGLVLIFGGIVLQYYHKRH